MYEIVTLKENLPVQYKTMLSEISEYYPVIEKATHCFNKSQSQYMNNMLTVSHPTELRNLRQILAQLNRAKQALDEAYFNLEKEKVELKIKKRDLENETDDLKKELLQIEIGQAKSQLEHSIGLVEGCVRKVSGYVSQYKHILKEKGIEEMTEADFEKDEENYHIMKMFEQALCAARSRQGVIDEGNHIYCYQIGISGTAAQMEVSAFLAQEGEMVKSGKMPTHEHTWKWMHEMAKKYSGSAQKFCQLKGMELLQEGALHESE